MMLTGSTTVYPALRAMATLVLADPQSGQPEGRSRAGFPAIPESAVPLEIASSWPCSSSYRAKFPCRAFDSHIRASAGQTLSFTLTAGSRYPSWPANCLRMAPTRQQKRRLLALFHQVYESQADIQR